jgi:hypothetical protein
MEFKGVKKKCEGPKEKSLSHKGNGWTCVTKVVENFSLDRLCNVRGNIWARCKQKIWGGSNSI